MQQDFNFHSILAAAHRANWAIEDVIGADDTLDFTRPFLPEPLARTAQISGLDDRERLIVNHIRAHEYLSVFGIVEEFILPFVLDHARPQLDGDDDRVRALLQFACEEAKHIQLFKRFHERFVAGFGTGCAVIGPAAAIGTEVLDHDPLAVALVILHVEWMTQSHYVGSVRDDVAIDPLFASLLRHHWMEEAQHARIDTLMVEALADGRNDAGIEQAIDDYLAIVMFIDDGLKAQAALNLAAFESATGRTLEEEHREAFLAAQHRAASWTYLGSGMAHPRFRRTLGKISPAALARVDGVAPLFS
jgi:hypothetical protein